MANAYFSQSDSMDVDFIDKIGDTAHGTTADTTVKPSGPGTVSSTSDSTALFKRKPRRAHTMYPDSTPNGLAMTSTLPPESPTKKFRPPLEETYTKADTNLERHTRKTPRPQALPSSPLGLSLESFPGLASSVVHSHPHAQMTQTPPMEPPRLRKAFAELPPDEMEYIESSSEQDASPHSDVEMAGPSTEGGSKDPGSSALLLSFIENV